MRIRTALIIRHKSTCYRNYINDINILQSCWYFLLLISLVTGERSLSSRSRSNDCIRHSDCQVEFGEICYMLYEGCSQGRCMCNPANQIRDKRGRCRTVLQEGDACRSGDKCPDSMTCHYNRCRCHLGVMTAHGDYCLKSSEKLLGQSCDPALDTCLQKTGTGYISDEVHCSDNGTCTCDPGRTADGYSCRRHRIDEEGCIENHHCDGGSVCVYGRCVCPPGRIPMAGNTKCGRLGALHGLPLRSSCDEIGELMYCDKDLVCHHCGEEGKPICVRSRLPSYQSSVYAQAPANPSPCLTCFHLCLVNMIVCTLLLIR